MPHNPIPGKDDHIQTNPNSGIQNTTHKGDHGDRNPQQSHQRELSETGVELQVDPHTGEPLTAAAAGTAQSTEDVEGGAAVGEHSWVRPQGASAPRADQDSQPWYADDRIGLVIAGLVVVGVLAAAWAVHRDD